MSADLDTLRGLRALVKTALERVDDAIAEAEARRDVPELQRGKTPSAVLRVVRARGTMRPREIADVLRAAGRDVTDEAVYAACSRHVRAGKLRREGAGRYAIGGAS